MPLKCAKVPSEWRKKRSIGIMRSMAFNTACGGAMLRDAKTCRSGKQFEQYLDDRAGIAADMAAVRQDLPLDLLVEALGRGFDVTRLAGDAERGIAERDDGLHARDAAPRVARGMAQIAHLADQAAQVAPVKPRVGVGAAPASID